MSAIRHFGLRWLLPVLVAGVAWSFVAGWLGLEGDTRNAAAFLVAAVVSMVALVFALATWGRRPGPRVSPRVEPPTRPLCGFEYPLALTDRPRAGRCVKPKGHAPPWHRDELGRTWYRIDFDPPVDLEAGESVVVGRGGPA